MWLFYTFVYTLSESIAKEVYVDFSEFLLYVRMGMTLGNYVLVRINVIMI